MAAKGRDNRGRFAKGRTFSKGNPHAKSVNRLPFGASCEQSE